MKILVDENMPYARELFSRLGDVQAIPGRPVPADALTDADALMVRSVTRVNEALLVSKAIKFVGTATAQHRSRRSGVAAAGGDWFLCGARL
ncbi:hypothetical protein AB6U14_01405 [Klebsiella pneumoniae]